MFLYIEVSADIHFFVTFLYVFSKYKCLELMFKIKIVCVVKFVLKIFGSRNKLRYWQNLPSSFFSSGLENIHCNLHILFGYSVFLAKAGFSFRFSVNKIFAYLTLFFNIKIITGQIRKAQFSKNCKSLFEASSYKDLI